MSGSIIRRLFLSKCSISQYAPGLVFSSCFQSGTGTCVPFGGSTRFRSVKNVRLNYQAIVLVQVLNIPIRAGIGFLILLPEWNGNMCTLWRINSLQICKKCQAQLSGDCSCPSAQYPNTRRDWFSHPASRVEREHVYPLEDQLASDL